MPRVMTVEGHLLGWKDYKRENGEDASQIKGKKWGAEGVLRGIPQQKGARTKEHAGELFAGSQVPRIFRMVCGIFLCGTTNE